ncbi:RING finger protein 141-like isoform X2 [Asterias rubens]|nr:RING finger protein 141-like isoform X2 [Asterias rubens]
MGHNQSNVCGKQNSLSEWRDFFFSQGHLLKQIATLKYADFVKAIEGLNTISNTLSSSRGRYLVFSIIPGTDCTSMLWRSKVRVKCCKMTSALSPECESTRTMTLKQFVQVYASIMQQCESIEDRQRSTDVTSASGESTMNNNSDIEEAEDVGATEIDDESEDHQTIDSSETHWLEVSSIFATVEQVSLESTDEGDCCICMEKKSDIVLNCAHTYCQACIDDWRKQHNTCPLCMGDIGSSKDVWTLPDKPNTEEMTTYLMGIADGHAQTQPPRPTTRRSDVEEWETVPVE